MEGNKGYRSGNDLFVCFPSRASIRMMQRSILSPGRIEKCKESSGGGSRRKGGPSSPMFPVLLRRKNASSNEVAAEEEEPSSPKVTCIGQVRVKSKQRKGAESLKRWGSHMYGIRKEVCHGLRSLGGESSCFSQCSRSSPEGKEHEKQQSACAGTVLAKWFMILQEGEEKQHEKLDPDTRKQEKTGKFMDPFEELKNPCAKNKEKMHPDDEKWTQITKFGEEDGASYCGRNGYGGVDDDEEEEPICIPPRNALLLMRCRSEPLRVSLDSSFWMAHSNGSEPHEPHKTNVCQDSNRGRLASCYGDKASDNDEESRGVQDSEATVESLPQALVLMRCEPELTKLSLEVCKETWVSSRDFLMKPMVNRDDDSRRLSKKSSDQEGSSSTAVGMGKMLGEKYSPPGAFMLTRCNSEPPKLSVKLAPEACLWKRRNLGRPLTLNI